MRAIQATRRRACTGMLIILLVAAAFSGCTNPLPPDGDDRDGRGDNGDQPPPERTWENPYGFQIHFDGDRAYWDVLTQIYDDPDTKQGPRHRIPGTPTHDVVAHELYEGLQDAMAGTGGSVAFQNFTGEDYYALDLGTVMPSQRPNAYVCDTDDPRRERVQGLKFMNVVARTNDTHLGFIIGAHWDSKQHVTPSRDPDHQGEPILGADDGASGTAAVIELARAFAADPIDIPLTFVLFDGEDGFEDCHPLAGSLQYAQGITGAEQETVHGLILLDMVGNNTGQFRREGHSECYPYGQCEIESKWLIDHVWTTAAEMGVEAFVNGSTGNVLDDHVPFLHEGIHAIDIINYGPHNTGSFPPYWHTVRDDHTALQPEGLEQVGAVVEASLRLYDQHPDLIGS